MSVRLPLRYSHAVKCRSAVLEPISRQSAASQTARNGRKTPKIGEKQRRQETRFLFGAQFSMTYVGKFPIPRVAMRMRINKSTFLVSCEMEVRIRLRFSSTPLHYANKCCFLFQRDACRTVGDLIYLITARFGVEATGVQVKSMSSLQPFYTKHCTACAYFDNRMR